MRQPIWSPFEVALLIDAYCQVGNGSITKKEAVIMISNSLRTYAANKGSQVDDTVGGLSMEYICIYINAINLSPYVTGTAQPKMNSILVPIPPIEEQHRIVAKIEEIMPYINTI